MNNDQTSNGHQQAVNSRSDLQGAHGADGQANN